MCDFFLSNFKNYDHNRNHRPSTYSNSKFLWKNKIPLTLGANMHYLGVFRLQFEKPILIFEISTLGFAKNEFSIDTIHFGMNFGFS